MIADVEARVRHGHAAEQRRDRRLTVERMRAMHDETGFDRLLARLFGIERRPEVARRHRGAASTAGHHACAGRGRIDVDAAGHLKGLEELVQAALLCGFDDQVERVLPLHDRFAENLHAVLSHVRTAQVIQKPGTHVGILRGTSLGRVVVSHDEQRHGRLLVSLLIRQVS